MAHFVLNHSLLTCLLLVTVSLSLSILFQNLKREGKASLQLQAPSRPTMASEGVKIDRNPSQAILTELGVSSWPTWGCEPSKFPWTFSATETMYLLEGKVKVNVEGNDGFFEIRAGDLVVFPKGMKVTWDVIEAVKKHYSLEK